MSMEKSLDNLEKSESDPEEEEVKRSMVASLPKDMEGKIADGTYYYIGRKDGSSQALLIIVGIVDNKIINTCLLDAKSLFEYMCKSRPLFDNVKIVGVV